MAFKLLHSAATVPAVVRITRHDGDDAELPVRYHYRSRSALDAWIAQLGARPPVESLAEAIEGWDADTPYTADALAQLLDQFPASANELVAGCIKALTESRAKD